MRISADCMEVASAENQPRSLAHNGERCEQQNNTKVNLVRRERREVEEWEFLDMSWNQRHVLDRYT